MLLVSDSSEDFEELPSQLETAEESLEELKSDINSGLNAQRFSGFTVNSSEPECFSLPIPTWRQVRKV